MVQDLDRRLFLNQFSRYSVNILLEFVLLLANVLQFSLQTLYSPFFPSPLLNDSVADSNELSFCATLSSGRTTWTMQLWSPPRRPILQHCLPRASILPLAWLGVLPSYQTRSLDVSTVCVKLSTSCAIASLSGDKSLSFVMFLQDKLLWRFVA